MGAKRQKGKISNFSFLALLKGKGSNPLRNVHFSIEDEKWVSAPFGEKISLHTRYILAHKRICGIQV